MKSRTSFLLHAMTCSRVAAFPTSRAARRAHRLSNLLSSTSTSIDSFNPIGPPSILSEFPVGESFSPPSLHNPITRLSQSPDLFYIKNFVSQVNRDVLISAACNQGMKAAGTRKSESNTIRRNSYLTWIDPYSIIGEHDETSRQALDVAREMILHSQELFVHEAMHKVIQEGGQVEYFFAEDVQIAKYDEDGRFDYHHDGYSRYLTVLVYLNGVGGTYFPFANLGQASHEIDIAIEENAVDLARERKIGKDGILLVGKEGVHSYLSSWEGLSSNSVIEVEAGDAIAFYSYKPTGDKDWRAVHCSLTVPEEKWIATCWFRSDALTGPFSYLKKSALLESS
ncbi:hypothetical protein HJC23_001466 [Cyclotella cryptica]|uniref:Fe2OG dioxygenase domain-containing protein n=1 Tax=Cyclotella cryptica TaxID=29204 RepID=A0ABD3NRY9_9STRA|eukprot:CCRYP_019972-RA/>CCRYP_019972-RA protein AED:0.02 eAED:0.02 QI:259/-1/1/1/-1/1/1/42/338